MVNIAAFRNASGVSATSCLARHSHAKAALARRLVRQSFSDGGSLVKAASPLGLFTHSIVPPIANRGEIKPNQTNFFIFSESFCVPPFCPQWVVAPPIQPGATANANPVLPTATTDTSLHLIALSCTYCTKKNCAAKKNQLLITDHCLLFRGRLRAGARPLGASESACSLTS